MNNRVAITILGGVVAGTLTASVLADTAWIQSSGSNDWTSSANWNNNPAGDGNFGQGTISVASGTENIYYLNSRWTFYSGSGFTINNNDNSNTGTNKLIIGSDGNAYYVDGDYFFIQNRGKLEISNGSSLTAYHQFFVDPGGELILNHGSVFIQQQDYDNVYLGGKLTSENGGTFDANAFNFARGLAVKSGGQIEVQSGLLWVETGGNTSTNGLWIENGGTLTVDAGATFALDRNDSAWGSLDSNNPRNYGNIMLNGGSITMYYNGNQATDRGMDNHGVIQGSGTLAMRVRQYGEGSTIASNGILNLFQTIAGNQQTFTSGSPGDYGTFKAVSGGTLRINGDVAPGAGFGGAWIVDSGGTLEVMDGNNFDLGQAYMPGGNLNGTVKVNSGGNMTLASTGAFGPTVSQNGTFLFNGGTISMPDNPGLSCFTNTVSGIFINNGDGVFRTGHGPGQNNYGILNQGTIIATNGYLTMFPDDAADVGGFQNQGTVRVANDGTLVITRSQNAWNTSAISSPTNLAFISLEGGTLAGSNTTTGVNAGTLVNASSGSITGSGTLAAGFNLLQNAGTIQTTGVSPLFISASALNNAAGGVITAGTGGIVVNGPLNNASGGTVTMFHSVGTFNGTVVNSGAWITDPSTNVFHSTYTVTSSGFISAAAGDVYEFRSNFVNQSAQNTSYDTFNTTAGASGAGGTRFIFDGTNTVSSSSYTQAFFTAGLKLAGGFVGTPSSATATQQVSSFAAVTGFQNNYALDRLEIGNLGTNSLLELSASDDIDGASSDTNALFVNDLWLFGSSDLIISNNTVLYFVNSNNWSIANVTLLGNGEVHQLTLEQTASVPEPGVLLLWLCGLATVYGARRRANRTTAC